MGNEQIFTYKLIEKMEAGDYAVKFFNSLFPNGGTPIEILKKYTELGYFSFAKRLIWEFPYLNNYLELDKVDDSVFSLGDIHIKGDAYITSPSYIKGTITVDGKLTASKTGFIYANIVKADNVDISEQARIHAHIKTNKINIHDMTYPENETVNGILINCLNCIILGNVIADVIYKDGKLINEKKTNHIMMD